MASCHKELSTQESSLASYITVCPFVVMPRYEIFVSRYHKIVKNATIYHNVSNNDKYVIIFRYLLYTVDLENFVVKKVCKAHTFMILKHMNFFTMKILLSNN